MSMPLALDIERTVTVAGEIMDELTALMESESTALRDRRLTDAGAHAGQKEILSHKLDVLLRGLRKEQEAAARYFTENPERRDDLRTKWDRLAATTAENGELLRNTLELTEYMVNVVVDTARKATEYQAGYARSVQRGGRATVAPKTTPLSIAIDTEL